MVQSWVRSARTLPLGSSNAICALPGCTDTTCRQLRSKTSRRFVHRDDLTRIDAALAKARGTGGVWNAEYRVMHPPNHPHAGETRWVAVESSVVCDSQGIPKRLLGVTRDITHQKQAEQALAERNMQLSLAGKSARVGSSRL